MKVLLVEPEYRRASASFLKKAISPKGHRKDDESLWYPPLGLMKLSTFHKRRGDEVKFVIGCDESVFGDLFNPEDLWDRVYITSLFTFGLKEVVKTINFYKRAVGGSSHKIFVGGVMASLMPELIFAETTISPVAGILDSPKKIDLDGDENIDLLPPDYDILDGRIYAINDTYYGYTTKGCVNRCTWCGVPEIENKFIEYIDIKPIISSLRANHGDKSKLKLMDNNILASKHLKKIVDDLVALGYGRGEYTDSKKMRVVDFNQGVDSSYLNNATVELISRLNIRPLRIAFDRISEKDDYVRAVRLAKKHGFKEFSNYMLYNFKDTPKELYDRLMVNIELNEEWQCENGQEAAIYSYPMRFAPIKNLEIDALGNISREYENFKPLAKSDSMESFPWNRKFIRNVEIIKAAAHGSISPTPSLARRAIGKTFHHFIANLYMPEELLRNRNKYEKTIYENDTKREPGSGEIEEFYEFILNLIKSKSEEFYLFHSAVAENTAGSIKSYQFACKNEDILKWIDYYRMRN